jgi:hypothetical protein
MSGLAKDNDSASSSSKFGTGVWKGRGAGLVNDIDAIIEGGLVGKEGTGDGIDAGGSGGGGLSAYLEDGMGSFGLE